ncbi:uncharacterized protein LOC101176797 [Nomascus leucogenys]|uniref:uncharacterized protein LOC101176797 n=1 Tax=Nomascus leucogenys TaxID=61853 RepID=UPI00122DA356|nr:uncharacterized protein LOC101176797 [Nomascus leucogenys]
MMSASPGPAPASRRPLQAQVVLKSASPRPAPAARRPLQVQKFLESASPGPALPASQWPLSAQPRSCLSAAFPDPAFHFGHLFKAQNFTSIGLSRPGLLPPEGLHRPSLCLTANSPCPASSWLTAACPFQSSRLSAASAGPAPACQWPLQAHGAHSSQRPFQAQFLPSGGLPGPRTSSSRPLQTHLPPPSVLCGPSSSSRLRLQAQLLPPNNLFGLSSCPAPGGLGRPTASSSQAPQAQLKPHGGLSRLSCCPLTASPGPKRPPVGGLLWAQLGSPGDLCRPKSS